MATHSSVPTKHPRRGPSLGAVAQRKMARKAKDFLATAGNSASASPWLHRALVATVGAPDLIRAQVCLLALEFGENLSPDDALEAMRTAADNGKVTLAEEEWGSAAAAATADSDVEFLT